MTRRGISLLITVVIVASAAIVGVMVWVGGMPADARDWYVDYVGLAITIATPLGGAVMFVARRLWRSARSARRSVVERIAVRTEKEWAARARQRRVSDTHGPLPVRWTMPRSAVAPRVDAVLNARPRFPALPGAAPVTLTQLLEGGGREDLYELYAGLHTGRLVIVGPPGAGKSTAAIFLLLDALERRRQLVERETDPVDPADVPVPLLYTLHGWDPDPASRTFRTATEFVADQLRDAFPGAVSREQAVDLLESGRFTVILDGLDEVPAGLRPHVLAALGTAPFRVVVVSRTSEVAGASQEHVLTGAIAVELQPLTSRTSADYLLGQMSAAPTQAWQRVLHRLEDAPDTTGGRDDPVVAALRRPLLLTLAAETYTGRAADDATADELLDERRFPTADAIEEHLLTRMIDHAYRPVPDRARARYPHDQAITTLRVLARVLSAHGTRDLRWWELPRLFGYDAAPPRRLTLTWRAVGHAVRSAPLGAIVAGLAATLLTGTALMFAMFGEVLATLLAMLVGTASGIGFALVTNPDPMARSEQFPDDPTTVWARDRRARRTGLIVALVGWLASGVAGASYLVWEELTIAGPDPEPRVAAAAIIGSLLGLALALPLWSALGIGLVLQGRLGMPLGRAGRGALTALSLTTLAIGVLGAPATWAISIYESWLLGGLGMPIMLAMLGLALLGMLSYLLAGRRPAASLAVTIVGRKLARAHGTPSDLMAFLADAHERGILRTVGSTYQFRHATLQDRLSGAPRDPGPSAVAPPDRPDGAALFHEREGRTARGPGSRTSTRTVPASSVARRP